MIIFGGIHRISKFASIVVPFMAVSYILLALFIVIINIGELPRVIKIIVESAFGMQQAAGGMVGAAMMQGIKRGLFSNEAGEGSAPNAAATADISHPVKQGLLQSLGVFTDTLVICTCTAFIIILTGLYNGGDDGIILTTKALESEIGMVGRYFISVAVFLFAFSTIIGNYYYGETNIRFITSRSWALQSYRIVCGFMVLLGGLVSLQTAWSMVDICMGLMTLCNLIAIVFLSNRAFSLLKNYREQKKAGKNPEFHRDMLPEWKDEIPCWE
jgi:AGCS family alanine or glycine:cation symporter